MADAAGLPLACPHCAHTPGDYSLHHNLHFCNQCGKKVASQPPMPVAASAPVERTSGGFGTPPRASAPHAGDEDDGVVTFKHAMQSPPPPARFNQDVDPTPMPPSRTAPRTAPTVAAPEPALAVAVAAPVFPSTTPGVSPSSASAPASNVITLTEEEFSSLETTIRDEMKAAHSAETEILTMEFDTLSRDYAKVSAEKADLQRTMDEMMESFNKVVDDANARKNDFTAQTNILEAEMNQLRTQHQTQKTAHAALKEAHTQLKTDHDEQSLIASEQLSQLEKLRADNDGLRTQYEKLHKQAQEKLGAAGQEYRNLMAKNTEKDALISQLTDDLHVARRGKQEAESRAATLESSHSSMTQMTAQLESLCESKTIECTDLRAQLTLVSGSLAESRAKMDESQAISNVYKEQLVDTREKMREMEDASRKAAQFERDSSRLSSESAALAKENQQLKSQLFDSFQVEKTLKAQLEGSGLSPHLSQAADAAKAARLEQELEVMRVTLNTKETEHRELMAICEGLIGQVEALKAQ